MQKKFAMHIVGENQNRPCRNKFILKCINELPHGTKILDAGAGQLRWKDACRNLTYISQDFCQYDGTGDGKGLLSVGRGWNSDAESKKKIDIVCDIIDIPVEDKEFDAILCSEVLEHLQNPELAIKEFSRIIKDGGTLILTAPFCSFTHFAPFHYCTGFNIYWYEKVLDLYGFEIVEKERNGNYFSYVWQEVLRVPQMVKKYLGKKDLVTTILCALLAVRLKKYIRTENNSGEVACYGYHIKARKAAG